MEFTGQDGEQAWADVVAVAGESVVGLDFDGTLAPIVDDPAEAHIHPDAAGVLTGLAARVAAVAVVTGRPVRQALDLGDLERLGDATDAEGAGLAVIGQYGNERWSTGDRRVVTARPPEGLVGLEAELPDLLRRLGHGDAHVEDKGLALAVHTRRLADPEAAFAELLPALERLAAEHDLVVEPGRSVIEVRSSDADKGQVVRGLVEQHAARGFVFAGDDLGDVEAFDALADLRGDGLAVLLVCAASSEESALLERADVVVPGPDGVLDLLRRFTAEAGHRD